jgi:hypothetical protein
MLLVACSQSWALFRHYDEADWKAEERRVLLETDA